ncbi:aminocarboxymuconate-semialdehyde decarboxylase [Thermosporothrix hazakensis]|uniref:Aminocarboxymuconate-semialdehyde decarboxylase n=1 Tax=Thermosporothrix hazakensis TaxID=644383 RepID=A0A326U879_THEHA|nr:amidohydrolase family protein [Thermosporothrix hazakensis]PZW31901.1 aminocarboxymuconate-semialdehyde decarboxylase [Thermosporothrix hazakensis]GCE49774.1 hydrolase [Thermosporothrix hazakensis]
MSIPPVIDSHLHMLPPLVMKRYRTWVAEERPPYEGLPGMWASPAFEHPEEQIKALDAAGINAGLITFSSNAPGAMHTTAVAEKLTGPEMVRMVNDQIIAWAKGSNGRLIATAWVEPRFGAEAVVEMDRVLNEQGVQAFSMLTAYRGPGQPLRFLDHPLFFPVLEHAAKLNIPVFVHTSGRFNVLADMGEPALQGQAAMYLTGGLSMLVESTLCLLRLTLSDVLDRLPELRLVFGQLGGLFPFVLGRFDLIYELVLVAAAQSGAEGKLNRQDVATICRRLRDYAGNIYVDTHSMDRAALLCALEALGADRLLYGSDFPVTPAHLGRHEALEMIQALPVSEEVKAAILGGNALSLLSLSRLEEGVSR